jgi:hypothetical protein
MTLRRDLPLICDKIISQLMAVDHGWRIPCQDPSIAQENT